MKNSGTAKAQKNIPVEVVKRRLAAMAAVLFVLALSGRAGAEPADRQGTASGHEELTITSSSGVESDAAFFPGSGGRAVVFVPGARYGKESWFFLAERLQKLKIASVALSGSSAVDALNAVAYLREKKFGDITLAGGSMGGGGVLEALAGEAVEGVGKMIVLAPFGGSAVTHETVKKLFVSAEDDSTVSSAEVYQLYSDSSEPKTFKEYEGSDHAQELFNNEHREDLITLIIDFIRAE